MFARIFNTKPKSLDEVQKEFVDERIKSLIPKEKPLTSSAQTIGTSYKSSKHILDLPYDVLGSIFNFAILGDDDRLTREKYVNRDYQTIMALRHTSKSLRNLINSTELGSLTIAYIKYPEFMPPIMNFNSNRKANLLRLSGIYKESIITPNMIAEFGDSEYQSDYQGNCEHELETRISHLTHEKNGVSNNIATQLLYGIYEKFDVKYNMYSGFSLKDKSFTLDDLKKNSDLCFLLLVAKQFGFKIQGLDLNNSEHVDIIKAGANDYLSTNILNADIPNKKGILASLAEIPQNKTYIKDLGSVISTDTNFS